MGLYTMLTYYNSCASKRIGEKSIMAQQDTQEQEHPTQEGFTEDEIKQYIKTMKYLLKR